MFDMSLSFSLSLSYSGELREAVKSGDYMAVKLAVASNVDYNLDQEVCATFYSTEDNTLHRMQSSSQ